MWPAIEKRVQAAGRPRRLAWLPAIARAWAILAVVAALALGTTAYAIAPILNRAFQMEAGLQHVQQFDLGEAVYRDSRLPAL